MFIKAGWRIFEFEVYIVKGFTTTQIAAIRPSYYWDGYSQIYEI